MILPFKEFPFNYLCNIKAHFALLLWFVSSCSQAAPPVKVMSNDQLINMLQSKNDTLYVVNFWMTSCKPCIQEMPYFDQVNHEYREKNLRVLLLSLDQGGQALQKVEAFKNRFNVDSEIQLLNAPQYSLWLDKVDANYWGTTPATLIFNPSKNQRIFINQELQKGELEKIISGYLKE